ncbi:MULTISPECIES: LPS-assembly protein LptD [unclassified Rhizobium]|uniref:LPS-assembly protein LptD n=1 Tax=Rhizobium TaxID=379 RepID=UPI00084C2E18|nr:MULTISPECIES: LPS-assembly protein LptD [unclassified Rhizobium]OEC93076.1 Organic solvent tolerance protein [Rhizobium sp. YK2]QYA12326.1 LPS-assembly protein LptD [Rhizobium sp. AB2/73]UEQ81743.1 LPS-assembly protein LptD [Rhizobium sp. AB2/73]
MAAGNRKSIRKYVAALVTGTAACAYILSPVVAYAQANNNNANPNNGGAGAATSPIKVKVPEGSKLVLSSNELVYNKDTQIVTATGAVQINYGGYRMVAQKVEYNQKSGRMTALGNVELITPDGNRMYGDKMDVTDSFSDGFVNALRIEMPDNTRMVAEKGERVGGNQLILTKGVYTACMACSEQGRAPLWQVKAQRVVQNGVTHTIRLEHARFELFGQPIAYVPWVTVPDNTVKRKSGFLFPSVTVSQRLGVGVTVPYYYVISPSMDATVTATGYSNQGLLLQGEFRQRFENGTHTLRVAGISQMNPDAFTAGTTDAEHKTRGMINSKADFRINPRWTFGWDVMAQSDNNFSRTYGLDGLNQSTHTNQAYLTGIGKRNFFDMRAFYYNVQDTDDNATAQKQQAYVYPSVDYHYVDPNSVYGGELSATMNFTHLSRDKTSVLDNVANLGDANLNDRYLGLSGDYTRLSTELQWQRTFATDQGLVLTPLAALRGDVYGLDMNGPAANTYSGNYDNSDYAARGMATLGLEAKYPFLITTSNSTHVFEPIAQIYVRPDEQLAGRLPNEDAQSFVFDATNLFDRDKFSGFDRIEGGTRANVGWRYTASFDSGYKLQHIFGQSYQLAGRNSFATDDLVGAGSDSGLETTRSDYVTMFGLTTPQGISLSQSYRFDEKDFAFRRGDTAVGFSNDVFQTSLIYTHIAAQPQYGFTSNQDEIQSRAQIKFKEYWSVFGTVSYDLNSNEITRQGVGLSYEDECTIFTVSFLDKKDSTASSATNWSIGARLTFRTLGDVNLGSVQDATF